MLIAKYYYRINLYKRIISIIRENKTTDIHYKFLQMDKNKILFYKIKLR